MKPSNVTPRELYRPSSNWKFKGETRRRILPTTACSCSLCETAPLYGLTSVRTFAEVSRNTVAKCWRIRDAEVSSANVGTRKTNFWLIATVMDNECVIQCAIHMLDDTWNFAYRGLANTISYFWDAKFVSLSIKFEWNSGNECMHIKLKRTTRPLIISSVTHLFNSSMWNYTYIYIYIWYYFYLDFFFNESQSFWFI